MKYAKRHLNESTAHGLGEAPGSPAGRREVLRQERSFVRQVRGRARSHCIAALRCRSPSSHRARSHCRFALPCILFTLIYQSHCGVWHLYS